MPEPHYADATVTLYADDCLNILPELPDNSVDAVVTDPPYGLEFMGKEWDKFDTRTHYRDEREGIGYPKTKAPRWSPRDSKRLGAAQDASRNFGEWCELWAAECLRILKPGGHLLAFGGTRTSHRLACAVEDAGFEIRDSIAWLYGQGFAKSWNFRTMYTGKWCECEGGNPLPLDHAGNPDLHGVREAVPAPTVARETGDRTDLLSEVQRSQPGPGLGRARSQGPGSVVPGDSGGSGREDVRGEQPGLGGRVIHRTGEGLSDGAPSGPSSSAGEPLRGRTPTGNGGDDWPPGDAARRGASHQPGQAGQPAREPEAVPGPHVPLDDGALQRGAECPRCGGLDPVYKGFGTGIKPAFEPICVARKPLVGTVAANVLRWGTGALNVDACRIGQTVETWPTSRGPNTGNSMSGGVMGNRDTGAAPAGRWPANVVLDESQAAALDQMSGELASGANPTRRSSDKFRDAYGEFKGQEECEPARGADSGGASRFYFTAKASSDERITHNGVSHPTVKPLSLMRWLVRLACPPGGIILEPFAGSGTTVEAAILEGFRCIAIEREADYLPLITQRINRRRDPVAYITAAGEDLGLFGLDGEPA